MLDPVRYIDSSNENIKNSILYLEILSNYCQDKQNIGLYPYQLFLCKQMLEDENNFLLRFGTAKCEGVLRPYIYFERKKMTYNEFVQ